VPIPAKPRSFAAGLLLFFLAATVLAQSADDPLHVTVTMKPDGSKTIYQTDSAKHLTIATSVGAGGKTRGKIIYKLDAAGRYLSGEIFGPDGKLRMKTQYEYDAAGHLAQETQSSKEGKVQNKLVYSYDAAGRQTGYAIYDGSGRLLGQTTPKRSSGNNQR
jgi:YD repeat-containing protein